MTIRYRFFLLPLILLLFSSVILKAQDTAQVVVDKPNIFLDCRRCYERYLKENVDIVNFVRDPGVAQIQMIQTVARTGSGTEFTLKFIGLERFEGTRNVIVYYSSSINTEQEKRIEYLRHFRLGLVPFISQTSLRKYIGISYADIDIESEAAAINDPWNHWIFRIGGNFSLDGQESEKELELEGSFNASRVTEEWKINLEAEASYERSKIELNVGEGDSARTITITPERERQSFEGLAVKSLGPHWSFGASALVSSSSFNNIDLQIALGPAIEFNIFPYREYNRHEFTFLFQFFGAYVQYNDTTIYQKIDDFLLRPTFSVNYELTETWGGVNARLQTHAYLHNLRRNRFEADLRVNFRLFQGFSVFTFARYSLINDQISFPAEGITRREVLLELRDRLTGYSYRVGFGLSFTFGSIFNNIVNPRF